MLVKTLYHSNHWQYTITRKTYIPQISKNWNVTLFTHRLPVSVTQPNSLITWGWGFSFFITSSSDRRSFLSEAGAFAKKKNPKKFLNFYHYFIGVIVLLRWACFSVLCPLGLFCFVCIETIQLNEMPFKYSVLTYLWTQPYPNLHLLDIVHWITLHL